MSPIKRLWNLLSLYRKEIRQIYVYAIFVGAVNLTLPIGIQAIINFLQTGEYTSTWVILVGFVLTGIAVIGILQVLQLRIVENIQQDLFTRSSFEFAYRIPKISFLKLDKIHLPELTNRFFDTLTIQKGLPKILIDFSLAIFQITFGLILLAIYSPYFILLGIILGVILFIIFKITGPKGLDTSLKESKYKYKIAHWLEEIARANKSFKLYARNKFHLFKTDAITSDYLSSREKHFQVLLSQFRLFIAFKVIVAAGLLLLGGYLVFQERMNIGQFVAAEIIIILIINSVEKVLTIIESIYDVLTALDKIGFITDLQLDSTSGTATIKGNDGLSIRANDISFKYPDEKRKIFKHLSFEIKSNETIVLSGKSGIGKSTLLQVLAGFQAIEHGELYINNIPISNYYNDALRESYGLSLASNQIFEGTIKENITLGRNVNADDLVEILRILNLNDFIAHQSLGLDSIIDSCGQRLSQSVIQKILVARSIIGNPQLLLMEDPLQFIEEQEKRDIIDYIFDKKRNWTVIIISNYYYWQEKCDRVLELNQVNNN